MAPETPKVHCAYLEGTTGYQCVLSLCRIKGIPTKAQWAHGDLDTPRGRIDDRSFYFCVPALMYMAAHMNGKNPSYDDLIKEQEDCSYYDTERKIEIPKKWHVT
ncbi:hypothetical protein A2313_01565 [Candidatus Roizmanbacteria bacterium RIFOXYB2_FULL_41_10]|uniref:Uncharacterized protein n=1 Tax=Candidatus Roizmanbacteria bacterium RIFOXYA1_FULL_41_12 TaxID=1802082 RepID=A0A1F7KGL6_9BACT|nr:MAG: hypothetical protein A2262_02545 [Candidatus Roizmanbacteria bacterium RIFOXYA2_FULL_41_8]OGK66999.1 MAG: hypothetical protein A2209_03000 [Candidatus Roizmanbacteria bacterium RIFOXYA1_FULL_41_12]OGK71056.1 MAG: hypothetical protein A2313_01565 [Candidatus Roizmanbacteria bacterium RIFOXYB2_FULL_41_10]OGK71708.1 MAG: hypothetical protein A2403_04590 [Candidatus Roizmanbacteria bacterium RIFOXYC1_FULL_41_16]OGK72943.1 MAG: hypothetical protein A2459_00285 [Candidatus Roizmanbacteria bac